MQVVFLLAAELNWARVELAACENESQLPIMMIIFNSDEHPLFWPPLSLASVQLGAQSR